MNCKKIQNILITDYLDGELNSGVLSRIEQHMNGCIHCRQFEQGLQRVSVPFKRAKHIKPPARVWEGIREEIIAKQLLPQGSLFDYLIEWLREFLLNRRAVFATATISFAIIVAALIFYTPAQIQTKTDTVAEDIVSMIDEEHGAIYDFGTDIEKYFL